MAGETQAGCLCEHLKASGTKHQEASATRQQPEKTLAIAVLKLLPFPTVCGCAEFALLIKIQTLGLRLLGLY